MFDFKSCNRQADTGSRRTKGELSELCDGMVRRIASDFQIRTNTYGAYAAFHIVNDPAHVYYGGKSITKVLQDIALSGAREELPEQNVLFKEDTAKFEDGRMVTYYYLEFC